MMQYKEPEEFKGYEDTKNTTEEVDPWTATSIITLLAFIIIILGLVIFNYGNGDPRTKTHITDSTKDTATASLDPFNDILLEAKAVFVFDVVRQEVLYARNEEAQLPLASLTKLMTVLVAEEILPEKATITITQDSLALEGDSGLLVGEKWRLEDLLGLTLLSSSNDGASAVAGVAGSFKSSFPDQWLKNKETFVYLMNKKAKDIGLTQTYFLNETGLDASRYAGGGYGSAKDIARLLEYSIQHVRSIIDVTRYTTLEFLSLNNINHIVSNTNKLVDSIPGLIASKTGFTDLSGGNLVVAFDAGINHPIIISVLGSTLEGRFRDIQKLVEASLKKLTQQ